MKPFWAGRSVGPARTDLFALFWDQIFWIAPQNAATASSLPLLLLCPTNYLQTINAPWTVERPLIFPASLEGSLFQYPAQGEWVKRCLGGFFCFVLFFARFGFGCTFINEREPLHLVVCFDFKLWRCPSCVVLTSQMLLRETRLPVGVITIQTTALLGYPWIATLPPWPCEWPQSHLNKGSCSQARTGGLGGASPWYAQETIVLYPGVESWFWSASCYFDIKVDGSHTVVTGEAHWHSQYASCGCCCFVCFF